MDMRQETFFSFDVISRTYKNLILLIRNLFLWLWFYSYGWTHIDVTGKLFMQKEMTSCFIVVLHLWLECYFLMMGNCFLLQNFYSWEENFNLVTWILWIWCFDRILFLWQEIYISEVVTGIYSCSSIISTRIITKILCEVLRFRSNWVQMGGGALMWW